MCTPLRVLVSEKLTWERLRDDDDNGDDTDDKVVDNILHVLVDGPSASYLSSGFLFYGNHHHH